MKLKKRPEILLARLSIKMIAILSFANFEIAFAKGVVLKNDPNDGAIIGKWMAAGSGCRSTSEDIGDVKMKLLPSGEDGKLKSFQMEFALPDYTLKPLEPNAERPQPSLTQFARECAIRVSVQPPKGMKLSAASARTVANVSKDSASDLLLQGALKVGAVTLATHQRRFEKGTEFREREEIIDLVPGRDKGYEPLQSDCGQARIVGVDLTFLTNKSATSAPVDARIGRDKTLEISVGLEPCSI